MKLNNKTFNFKFLSENEWVEISARNTLEGLFGFAKIKGFSSWSELKQRDEIVEAMLPNGEIIQHDFQNIKELTLNEIRTLDKLQRNFSLTTKL